MGIYTKRNKTVLVVDLNDPIDKAAFDLLVEQKRTNGSIPLSADIDVMNRIYEWQSDMAAIKKEKGQNA